MNRVGYIDAMYEQYINTANLQQPATVGCFSCYSCILVPLSECYFQLVMSLTFLCFCTFINLCGIFCVGFNCLYIPAALCIWMMVMIKKCSWIVWLQQPALLKSVFIYYTTHVRKRTSLTQLNNMGLQLIVFSVAGPHVWNCLPPEVTLAPSLATFCAPLQNVSVHRVISWHSAHLTFLCLHTVYSGPSSVLDI